jgi:hypothetical protein
MVGPLPAGRLWTTDEEMQLLKLLSSGSKVPAIAQKLGRSAGAVHARISSLKKRSVWVRSLPSERAAFFHAHASSRIKSHRQAE